MAYEKGKPEPGIKAKELDNRVRGNNDFIQPAINNEHNFVDADANNQSGDHTQGSARCFSQDTAPTTRIDLSSFTSTDLGSLWVDTDDNAMYILTATAPTWTPVSTEVIATLLAANRVFAGTLGVDGNFEVGTGSEFTVAAASGNTTLDGTLSVGTSITLASGATPTEFSIDGTLAGDSDTAVPTEKAVKTYVDGQVVTGDFICKAWGMITGTTEQSTRNISSVTNPSSGVYIVNWTTDFATDKYAVLITPFSASERNFTITAQAAGSVTITFWNASHGLAAPDNFHISAFGVQ